MSYQSYLKNRKILLLVGKRLLFHSVNMDGKFLSLVPHLLQRILLDHYHGGPSGGYMGEYKLGIG